MFKDFFVFHGSVHADGLLSCDIYNDKYVVRFNNKEFVLLLKDLKEDSVFVLMYDNATDELIPFYNWDKLQALTQLQSMELLQALQQNAFFQLYYYGKRPFVKVFLPINQQTLMSNTHNFSQNLYWPTDMIHPLDYLYIPTFEILTAEVSGGMVTMEIDIVPSVHRDNMYLSYGGRAISVQPGRQIVTLPYAPGERVYVGAKDNRKKGCSFDLEGLLCILN